MKIKLLELFEIEREKNVPRVFDKIRKILTHVFARTIQIIH